MRRFSLLFLAGIIVLTSLISIVSVGECGKKAKKAERKDSKIICWAVTPWPIRHLCNPEDCDRDGVVNPKDKCPGTPKGAIVDEHGCPIDTDGDGVFDGIDKCPDTPKMVKVNKKGCPVDSDGDGVFDGIDECPDTPKRAEVDEKGCPIDTDGDGVLDGIDECPDTPKHIEVNKDGCPVETSDIETELLDTGMIRTTKINFEFGKSDIKKESYKVLDEIGEVLVQWPELEIEIGGHTDSQGSEDFNQRLSEDRAKAVYEYLMKKFPKIKDENLSAKGYGEEVPVAKNDTAEGRMENRRVEFKVLNKDELKRETKRKRYKRR